MKKKIFRSFATLLGLTCTAKLFSVLCRVILARTLSSEGYGLYMLVLPTLGFCLTLAQMGIPSAVFRLSSDPHYQPKRVLKKALSLSLVISLTIAFLLALLAPIIANTLFRQPEATGALYAIALFIPLASTNNTLRSYYLGREFYSLGQSKVPKFSISTDVVYFFMSTFLIFSLYMLYVVVIYDIISL